MERPRAHLLPLINAMGGSTEDTLAVGTLVAARGRRWTIGSTAAGSDATAVQLHSFESNHDLTLLTPFDRLRAADANRTLKKVGPRRWVHELDRSLVRLEPLGSLGATAHAPITLYSYQLEPALAIVRDGVPRVLLADGVGLGKTIQAGIVLLELGRRRPFCRALVVTPAGLREQWVIELADRLRLASTLADATWLRRMALERPADVNPWSLPGIYVVSHDFVKRPEVLRALEDLTWDAVVIDEAHAATIGTDRRTALNALAARARVVMLLTATPDGPDGTAFDGLCRLGAGPAPADRILIFRRSHEQLDGRRARKTTVLPVALSEAESRLQAHLATYSELMWREAEDRRDARAKLVSIVLRKRALSSASALLASVERRLSLLTSPSPEAILPTQPLLPWSADEDSLEDEVPASVLATPGLADAARERKWLLTIGAAAREAAAAERKLRLLSRLLVRIGEPVIVFTEYRDTLARLGSHLLAVGVSGNALHVLHGGLGPSVRADAVRDFNSTGGILLATDAASEGLNLHHRCRTVIHFELPWNPARLEQRAGRVDRLGQTRRVHEIALVASHTAEELVLAPLLGRARRTGGAADRWVTALGESMIARAVMDGRRIDRASSTTEPTSQAAEMAGTDLECDAVRETERLLRVRVQCERSALSRPRTDRPLLAVRRRATGLAPGLYLFFALSLRDQIGEAVHAEPAIARLELARLGGDLPPKLIHVIADRTEIRSAILSTQKLGDLTDLAASYVRLRQRQGHRELEIVARRRSAARRLVQPGLFDRRTLKEGSQTTAVMDETESDDRLAHTSPKITTTTRLDLIAALVVTRGRR